MPAKDIYQDTVKNALIKDGWVIWGKNFHIQVDEGGKLSYVYRLSGRRVDWC